MPDPAVITDAELHIMKVLWQRGSATSPEILEALSAGESRNRNTVKTLLLRLVQKGAVAYDPQSARSYLYHPCITQEQYIASSRRSFLDRVFDGSAQRMLLNFVREENVTREDLQRLMDLIEEDAP